jgi:fatty-acyl-CoA synthase
VVGGTALPVPVTEAFLKGYGVDIRHAWGMTEISPLGSTNTRKAENAGWDTDRFLLYSRKQGRPLFGVDFRVLDANGQPIAQDEVAFGELEVQGHWVASGYFNQDSDPAVTPDGWFRTGDVVTLDPLGEIEIVDRAKDVIKSGGEWISSITLENCALAHPDVAMAAAIPVRHPKWDERPLLLVVPKPGTSPDGGERAGRAGDQGGEVVAARPGGIRGHPAADRHGQAVEGGAEEAVEGFLAVAGAGATCAGAGAADRVVSRPGILSPRPCSRCDAHH